MIRLSTRCVGRMALALLMGALSGGAASLDACMPALAATPILTPASIAADPHLTVIGTSYATLP